MLHTKSLLIALSLLIGLTLLTATVADAASQELETGEKQHKLRRWFEDSDDEDDDIADSNVGEAFAANLRLVSMSISLPITSDSYDSAAQQEFKRIVSEVTNVHTDSIFFIEQRETAPSQLQIEFHLIVPTTKAATVASRLTQQSLESAMRSSSLAVFSGVDQVTVKTTATVFSYDDFEEHVGKKIACILGGLLMLAGLFWCTRRFCCRKCNKTSNGPSEAQGAEAGAVLAAVPTDKLSSGVSGQGLCYPVTSEAVASIAVEPVGHAADAQEAQQSAK